LLQQGLGLLLLSASVPANSKDQEDLSEHYSRPPKKLLLLVYDVTTHQPYYKLFIEVVLGEFTQTKG